MSVSFSASSTTLRTISSSTQSDYSDVSDLTPFSEALPFIPSETNEDKLLYNLYKKGVVDEDGMFLDTENLPDLPALSQDVVDQIKEWLDYTFRIKCSQGGFNDNIDNKKRVFFIEATIREAIENFGTDYPILLIGGTVREILKQWSLDAVQELPNCGSELFRNIKIRESKAPKDGDFRVDMLREEFTKLSDALDSLMRFFASKFCSDDSKLAHCAAAFRKKGLEAIHDLYRPEQYTMLSVKDSKEGRTADFNFVGKLSRDHLFISDAFSIEIGPDGKFSLRCTLPCKGWQVILDNVLNIIHIDDPHSVNDQGLPRIIRSLTMGGRHPQGGVIDILFETMLRLNQNNQQKKVLDHFDKCFGHHIAKGGAPVQMTFLLNILTIIHHHCPDRKLADALIQRLLKRRYEFKDTPCSRIVAFLQKNPKNYKVVDAWMQLAGLLMLSGQNKTVSLVRYDGGPALQWHDNDADWSLPLKPAQAIQTLLEFDGDLSDLQGILDVKCTRPGSFYRHRNHLDYKITEELMKGWNHSDPAIRRVCYGLSAMLHYREDPSKWDMALRAAEASNPNSLVRQLEAGSDEFMEMVCRAHPDVKEWNKAGAYLFDYYLSVNPDRAAEIFLHHYPHQNVGEQRKRFNQLVTAYKNLSGQQGETLVQCALKLKKAPPSPQARGNKRRRKVKTPAAPPVCDVTDSITWICGNSALPVEKSRRFRLLQYAVENKLVDCKKSEQELQLVACMNDALEDSTIPEKEVLDAWTRVKLFEKKKFPPGCVDFLLNLIEMHGSDPQIIRDLEAKPLSEQHKKRFQELVSSETYGETEQFLLREQKYQRRLQELKSAIQNETGIVAAYKAAKLEAKQEVDHNVLVQDCFETLCTNNTEIAITLYCNVEMRGCFDAMHRYQLLLGLPSNAHHSMRWRLLSEIENDSLENEQVAAVTKIIQQESGTEKVDSSEKKKVVIPWIDTRLEVCKPEQQLAFLRGVCHLGLSGVKQVDFAFQVVSEDLEAAHHVLSSLHTDSRSYDATQLDLLKKLVVKGSGIERRVCWMKRLMKNHQKEVKEEFPKWIRMVVDNGYHSKAADLLEQWEGPHDAQMDALWMQLIVEMCYKSPSEAGTLFLKKRSLLSKPQLMMKKVAAFMMKGEQPIALMEFIAEVKPQDQELWFSVISFLRSTKNAYPRQHFTDVSKLFIEFIWERRSTSLRMYEFELLFFCEGRTRKSEPVYAKVVDIMTSQAKITGFNDLYMFLSNRCLHHGLMTVLTETKDFELLKEVSNRLTIPVNQASKDRYSILIARIFIRATTFTEEQFDDIHDSLCTLFQAVLPGQPAFLDYQLMTSILYLLPKFPYRSLTHSGGLVLVSQIGAMIKRKASMELIEDYANLFMVYVKAYMWSPPHPDVDPVAVEMFETVDPITEEVRGLDQLKIGAAYVVSLLRQNNGDRDQILLANNKTLELLPELEGDGESYTMVLDTLLASIIRAGFEHNHYKEMFELITLLFQQYAGVISAGVQHQRITTPTCTSDMLETIIKEAKSIFDNISFLPKDDTAFFRILNWYIKALHRVDLTNLNNTQLYFWLNYTGELIAVFFSKYGSSRELSDHARHEILTRFAEYIEKDIPNINDAYTVHATAMRDIVRMPAFQECVSRAKDMDLALRLWPVMVASGAPLPNSYASSSGSPKLEKIFSRFSSASNPNKFAQGLLLLRSLQVRSYFKQAPDLLSRLFNSFMVEIKRFPFHMVTIQEDVKDTFLYDIMFRILNDGPLVRIGAIENKKAWRKALVSSVFCLLEEIFGMQCRFIEREENASKVILQIAVEKKIQPEQVRTSDLPQEIRDLVTPNTDPRIYSRSQNFIDLHNLVISQLRVVGLMDCPERYFDFVTSMLPTMRVVLKILEDTGQLEQILIQPLQRGCFSTAAQFSGLADPNFLFDYAGKLDSKAREHRRVAFTKWMDLVLGWKGGSRYQFKLLLAQQVFEIFEDCDEYRKVYNKLCTKHDTSEI